MLASAFFEPRDLGDVALGGFLAVDEDEAQAPSPLGHESVAAGSTTTTTTTSAGVSDDAWFEKALSQAGAAGCGAVDLTGAAQESFAEQKRPMASELDTIDMLEAHLGEAEHVQPTLESAASIHPLASSCDAGTPEKGTEWTSFGSASDRQRRSV